MILIRAHNSYYVYENIIKNFEKLDPWGFFMIKKYDKDGVFIGEYSDMRQEDILKDPLFKELIHKHNPELLI